MSLEMKNLLCAAQACIAADTIEAKISLTNTAALAFKFGQLSIDPWPGPDPIVEPGRPELPKLGSPLHVPRRKLTTPEGRGALIHAMAHIEFNAINLAWDAVYRFRDLPLQYYQDWVQVAEEEAYHFQLLRGHLNFLGYDYGDFEAHNGLWDTAKHTAHDVLTRMALVPRVLEARGLDVTPAFIQRLRDIGDKEGAKILEIILRDEIGHVAIGTRWFVFVCEQRGLDREITFQNLVSTHMLKRIKGPFYRDARIQAGFNENELQYLESIAGV